MGTNRNINQRTQRLGRQPGRDRYSAGNPYGFSGRRMTHYEAEEKPSRKHGGKWIFISSAVLGSLLMSGYFFGIDLDNKLNADEVKRSSERDRVIQEIDRISYTTELTQQQDLGIAAEQQVLNPDLNNQTDPFALRLINDPAIEDSPATAQDRAVGFAYEQTPENNLIRARVEYFLPLEQDTYAGRINTYIKSACSVHDTIQSYLPCELELVNNEKRDNLMILNFNEALHMQHKDRQKLALYQLGMTALQDDGIEKVKFLIAGIEPAYFGAIEEHQFSNRTYWDNQSLENLVKGIIQD